MLGVSEGEHGRKKKRGSAEWGGDEGGGLRSSLKLSRRTEKRPKEQMRRKEETEMTKR